MLAKRKMMKLEESLTAVQLDVEELRKQNAKYRSRLSASRKKRIRLEQKLEETIKIADALSKPGRQARVAEIKLAHSESKLSKLSKNFERTIELKVELENEVCISIHNNTHNTHIHTHTHVYVHVHL